MYVYLGIKIRIDGGYKVGWVGERGGFGGSDKGDLYKLQKIFEELVKDRVGRGKGGFLRNQGEE